MTELKGVHDDLDDEVAQAGDEKVPEDEVDRDPNDSGEDDEPEADE